MSQYWNPPLITEKKKNPLKTHFHVFIKRPFYTFSLFQYLRFCQFFFKTVLISFFPSAHSFYSLTKQWVLPLCRSALVTVAVERRQTEDFGRAQHHIIMPVTATYISEVKVFWFNSFQQAIPAQYTKCPNDCCTVQTASKAIKNELRMKDF